VHAQDVLNTIVSLVYDGLCQWLTAAVNSITSTITADSSSDVAPAQSSVLFLSSISDGDILMVSSPPPSVDSHLSSSLSSHPSASLALFHTNVMNERIRSVFIESFARCMGLDASAMAVSSALAAIDSAQLLTLSVSLPALSPSSLLALIEQETLAITTATPQARVASLASKLTSASSSSLLLTHNNTAVVVKHFIGDVTYSLSDFVEHNRMTISTASKNLLSTSSNHIVRFCLNAALDQVRLHAAQLCEFSRA
jgi:hypothetical protein